MTEQRLREILTAQDGEACDRSDRLWRASQGELTGAELQELLAHVQACGSCAADWALAVEARRELEADTPSSASSPKGMPAWAAYVAPLVVLAAILLGMALWARSPGEVPDTAWRAPTTNGVVLRVDDGGVAAGRVVSWDPVVGAVSYEVVLLSEDGRTLGRGLALTEPVWTIDAGVPSGAALWRVEARMEDGSARSSPTRRVQVP